MKFTEPSIEYPLQSYPSRNITPDDVYDSLSSFREKVNRKLKKIWISVILIGVVEIIHILL